MSTEPILTIELNQADPKKRGQIYGEAARERIHAILDKYHEIFQCITGETWEKTVERGEPFVSKAQVFAPDLVEEIRGIAEGADRGFMDIFLLNARSEILFNSQVLSQECTTVAALPESTTNGETLLAQNWDWYKEVKNCQVILKIGQREDKPALITFTEAGQLAKIGMNAAGIGLVVNNLVSALGRPEPVLLESFVEAERFAGTCYRAANWRYLGQTTGRGIKDKVHRVTLSKKDVLGYPLSKDFRRRLGVETE